MKKLWIVLIFLIPLGFIGWWVSSFFQRPEQKTRLLLHQVRQGKLIIRVKEQGVLEPKEVTQLDARDFSAELKKLNWPPSGFRHLRIVGLIPEGTKVAKNDMIIEFDRTEIDQQTEERQEKLKDDLDKYFTVLANLKTKEDDMELVIKSKKVARTSALDRLDALRQKRENAEISNIQLQEGKIAAEEARKTLANTESEAEILTRLLKLYDENTPYKRKTGPVEPVPDEKRPRRRGEGRGNETGPPQTITIKGAHGIPEELKDMPHTILARHLRPLQQALRRIETHQNKLEEISKYYPDKLIIKAPHDGYVFYGSHRRGSNFPLSIGGQVYFRMEVAYITNTAELKVELQVDEAEVSRIKTGQKIRVIPNAFPEISLSGEITEIMEVPMEAMPFSPGRRISTPTEIGKVKYLVTGLINQGDARLKPKMTVQVEITCEEIEAAIFVPLESVFEQDDQKVCYISGGQGPVARPVKTGKRNDDFIIIESGLKEGEEIYLYDPLVKKKPGG